MNLFGLTAFLLC